MASLIYHQIFVVYLTIQVVAAQQAGRQQPAQLLDKALMSLLNEETNNKQQTALDASLERVDKLASATGDLYWHPQQHQQQGWTYPQGLQNSRIQRSLDEPLVLSGGGLLGADGNYHRLPLIQTDSLYGASLDGPASSSGGNYHALVDEFKQYSRMANPSRESRAFKPKLMSTARGFGKRSLQSRSPYADSAASSNDKLAAQR